MVRNYLGREFRIASEPSHMPYVGELIEIVEAVRGDKLWLARTAKGETFEVHTDWLDRYARLVPKEN
jgi:hypothetical protein